MFLANAADDMAWLPVLWPAMKVPTFIDVVEIIVSFMFPWCLPSRGRWVCDRSIASTRRLCISDHQDVFTFICCQFCGKTGSYYTRKTLPYITKEGGQHHLLLLLLVYCLYMPWFQLIKIHTLNRYNAPNCQLVILWKWSGYQHHHSKPFSSHTK